MKQLLEIRGNLMALPGEKGGPLLPTVEVVVVAGEPGYSVDAAGQLKQETAVEVFRFAVRADELRAAGRLLGQMADDVEDMVDKAAALVRANVPDLAAVASG
jgi:hypothetical protein